jgi:6-phosphogluconolactonase
MTSAQAVAFDYGERGDVRILGDMEELAGDAATLFAHLTMEAVNLRGRAIVALSGGSTPRRMGELLAASPLRDEVPWNRLHVFWGDERWVPERSAESNAGEARRTFLSKVPIPRDQIHAFPTVGLEPDGAAAAYETTIREVLGDGEGSPQFDLVLLGMGDDGHTASLFPRTLALKETERLVVANYVPKLMAMRLTFSAPLLNGAREVVFLVSGGGKAEALAAVLEGAERTEEYPAQLIRPVGPLLWLIDRDASAKLSGPSR